MKKNKIIFLIVLILASLMTLPCYGYNLERATPLNTTTVSANYGQFRNASGTYPVHDGIDYPTKEGEPVYAVTSGTAYVGNGGGWGNYVIITSSDSSFQTRYAHLSEFRDGWELTKLTKKVYPIAAGEIIGKVGHTGVGSGDHLHFGIGQTVTGGNQVNPIVNGLKQPANGNAVFEKIKEKIKDETIKYNEYLVFYDAAGDRDVNYGLTNQPLQIICEAYQDLPPYYSSNPYKVKIIIKKAGDPNYEIQPGHFKEIEFKDLNFDVNNYYHMGTRFNSYFLKDGSYKNFFYMDFTPEASGTYTIEAKTYVAYWNGDTLVYPNDTNPEAGRTHTKTRTIEIADSRVGLIDSTGIYAWQPPAYAAAAAGIKAADVSWPSPRYVTDLSNTIFTTNTTDVSPDFQKYTEFTVAATRNTDWTIRIKNASSGTELTTLTASGQETVVKWEGAGMGSGKYKYEIEAKDPLTGVVSTKEGISLITVDNDKPDLLANWGTAFPTKTSITASNDSTGIHFAPQEDLYSVGVNIVDATNHDNKIITGLGWNPSLKQNETFSVSWDGAGHYPEGAYQFEIVMTDLAGNINRRYSNPVVINTSGNYVPPALESSPLVPPPYNERAIITDISFDSSGNQYVLYGRVGQVVKYDNPGNVLASSDPGRIELVYPQALAVSPATGRIYVADTYNNRIVVYDKDLKYIITVSDGVAGYLREWRKKDYFLGINTGARVEWGGPYLGGSFYKPTDIVISPDGQVFVTDSANHRILKFEEYSSYIRPGEVFKGVKYDVSGRIKANDGPFLGWAETDYCYFYSSGINDSFDHFYYMSNVRPYENYGNENGKLTSPESVALDSFGSIYISDTGNNRIQKFNPDGSFVAKFGEGILNAPKGMDIDTFGNIWVADTGTHRIVQFNPVGKLIKEYKSDEYVINPQKIKVKDGKIYIADAGHDRPLVWNVGGNLTNVRVTNAWISPNNDSVKDSTRIQYSLSQPAGISAQLIPKTSGGASAQDVSSLMALNNIARGIGNNEETWDGTRAITNDQDTMTKQSTNPNEQNSKIADGNYSLKLIASFGDYKKSKIMDVNIDTTNPTVSLDRAPPAISPNADDVNDSMLIDYSISDNLSPTAEVKISLWKKNSIFVDPLLNSLINLS